MSEIQNVRREIAAFAVPREVMSPAWQRVHDHLFSRGYTIAAQHMGQLIAYMRPSDYWANNGFKVAK
jgi:hypothetical protein